MNIDLARILLSNLLERAQTAKEKIFLTSKEIEALEAVLSGEPVIQNPLKAGDQIPQHAADTDVSKKSLATVNVGSDDIPRRITACIDFGTAYSKAFATIEQESGLLQFVELTIGIGKAGPQLMTPSEVLIDRDRIYFGSRAREQLDDTQQPIGRIIDSIKQFITLNEDVSKLSVAGFDELKDPTCSFSRRDILTLYLAHLMCRTEAMLAKKELSTNVRRRFAHPAWKANTKEKNENEMRMLMAEAIVLARTAPEQFQEEISVSEARTLLKGLTILEPNQLPLALIAEPVREATAAGAGAISATPEHRRETYLIIDVGAGTTDVAGFICVNNPEWEKPRLFEISGAADAKNVAGNVLDNALQKYILERSSLMEGTEEFRMAGLSIRRSIRLYKEQLFNGGAVTVPLPTDEIISVELASFRAYPPVVEFAKRLNEMIARSASVVAGDSGKIALVPTGGGSALPFIRELAEHGVEYNGRHIAFSLQDPVLSEVRASNLDLVPVYPQIAVALGGALPNLPEQRHSIAAGLENAPVYVMAPSYKS